jgi:hypothetical protein
MPSRLQIDINEMPDGNYKTILTNPTDDSLVFAGSLDYLLGLSEASLFSVDVSTALTGFVIDNELTHIDGAVITGITIAPLAPFIGFVNLEPTSSMHYQFVSPITRSANFDISFNFYSRAAGIEIMLGNSASGTGFIACINGKFRVNIGSNIDSPAGTIKPYVYYNARVTREGTLVTLYIDDAQVGSSNSSTALTINVAGMFDGGTRYFNGYLTDLYIDGEYWTLGEFGTNSELSAPSGIALNYVNILESSKSIATLDSSDAYWWLNNGDVLELDVQQPAADVIAILGQSNNLSEAVIVEGVDDQYAELEGNFVSYGYKSQSRTGAVNPLDNEDNEDNVMGYWRNMALALSGRHLLIPASEGGTGFSNNEWVTGGTAYEQAVIRINAGMLTNNLNTFKCVVWLQGESDALAGMSESTYLSEMNSLRSNFIADTTAIVANTPWVVIHIKGPTGSLSAVTAINNALTSFAAAIPFGRVVTTSDLTMQDTLHFDAVGIREIGVRVAAAINSL